MGTSSTMLMVFGRELPGQEQMGCDAQPGVDGTLTQVQTPSLVLSEFGLEVKSKHPEILTALGTITSSKHILLCFAKELVCAGLNIKEKNITLSQEA